MARGVGNEAVEEIGEADRHRIHQHHPDDVIAAFGKETGGMHPVSTGGEDERTVEIRLVECLGELVGSRCGDASPSTKPLTQTR